MKRMIKRFVAGAIMVTMLTTPVFAKEGDKIFNEELQVVFTEVHKDGEVYLQNQITGELIKVENTEITFKLGEKAGTRTIKAIVKNGVTMVSLVDLAKAMDVKLEDLDKKYPEQEMECYSLVGYYGEEWENKGDLRLYIDKPKSKNVKKGEHYSYFIRIYHESGYKVSQSKDIKFAPKIDRFDIVSIDDPAVYPDGQYVEGFIPYTNIGFSGKFSAGKSEYINNVLYVPAKDVINLINREVTEVKYNKANKTITFEKKAQYYHEN